jgi:hypothetical protein
MIDAVTNFMDETYPIENSFDVEMMGMGGQCFAQEAAAGERLAGTT